jgi:hypothetical protein
MSDYAWTPTPEQIARANVTRLIRAADMPGLPKTRSAKILRRAIRATVIGAHPGALSGAENPQAREVIRAVLGEPAGAV